MPDVFLSYSRKDHDFVDRLRAALESKQRTVWVDRQDIIPSEEWNPKIREGIDESSHFVFIWCVASNPSGHLICWASKPD